MPSHHKPKGRSKNAGGNGGWKAVGAEKAKADKLAAVPEACTVDQASTTNSSFFDFDALDGSAKAEAVEANNAKHEVNEVEESQQAPVPDLVTTVAQEEAEAVVANNAKHEVGEVEESHQAPVPALVTTVAQDEAWLHMSSSARLKYKIVKCTSEDPEYPVSELLAHSSTTKGWQTGRFCDFPQEIGLQFETPVHLRQVQFLSHQSKIATKIELFTALPAEGQNCRYETAQFKRLGYLSLDSNERSQFQARELKSVYVDVSAQFLRVVLHKCHVNRYNIVNQVGLIALHCSGEVLGPDLSVGPPPPNPALARNNIVDNSQAAAPAPAQRAAAMPEARAAVAPGPPPAVSANAMDHAPEVKEDPRLTEDSMTRWQVELGDDGEMPSIPGDQEGVLRIMWGDSVLFSLPAGAKPTMSGNPSLCIKTELGTEQIIKGSCAGAIADWTAEWLPEWPGPYEISVMYPQTANDGGGIAKSPAFRMVVDPALAINGKPLPARSIIQLTELSRLAGPIERWPEALASQAALGYNMVHFTPIQTPGESGSCYSLDDQNAIDPTLMENPSGCPKERLHAVRTSVERLEKENGMLSAMDIVLNHTSGTSPWLLDHPEAAYNLSNSPHLAAAAELDQKLAWYSDRLRDGHLGGPHINDHNDVNRVVDGVVKHVLQPLNLREYFFINERACYEARSAATASFDRDDYDAFKHSALPSIGAQRRGVVITGDAARRYCRNDHVFGEYIKRLQGDLHDIFNGVEHDILDAVRGVVTWERLEQRNGPVGNGHLALVPSYFRELKLSQIGRDSSNKETEVVAHNGWVMGWPATEDFGEPNWRFVYLRRHLCAWGDCVKLRYGRDASDAPFLWDFMTKYATSMASIFHAIRLDNAHSTPLHVSQYVLAQVRKTNPHCWIFAELFTGDFQTDLHYQRTLGINALIREAMQCDSPGDIAHKLTSNLWGAHPIGAVSFVPTLDRLTPSGMDSDSPHCNRSTSFAIISARTLPLRPRNCPALLFDCTHDNQTPKEKRHPRDALPNAALVAASCASAGSVRGYDELLPFNPSVVFERRPYQQIRNLDQVKIGWHNAHPASAPEQDNNRGEGQDGQDAKLEIVWPHGATSSVTARGAWDGWKTDVPLKKQPNGAWIGTIFVTKTLLPVQYKFIVDGQWVCDDKQPTARDEHGTLNNALGSNKDEVQLEITWPHGAERCVKARGAWDSWSSDLELRRNDRRWTATVKVSAKQLPLEYKFIVDGNWTHDAEQPCHTDASGNTNNVLKSVDANVGGYAQEAVSMTGPDILSNKHSGILSVKQVLNSLHEHLGREGFVEVGVERLADDILAVQRRCPDTGRSTWFLVRTAYWRDNLHDGLPEGCATLEIQGVITHLHVAAALFVNPDHETNYVCDEASLTGLQSYLHLFSSIHDVADVWRHDGGNTLKLKHFPPGSVLVFSTSPSHEASRHTQLMKLLGHPKLSSALQSLSMSELNYLLFSCEAEEYERSGGARGAFDVPEHGPFMYCGLMGVCSALDQARNRLTDLAESPIMQNVKAGDWLLNYLVSRLSDMPGLTHVQRWFEEVQALAVQFPRALAPFYFDVIVSTLCSAAAREFLNGSGSFVAVHSMSSRIVRDLALATTQFWGATSSAPLHWDRAQAEGWRNVPSLCAGLPHFSSGFMRNWGRDTFIALRGCLLVTQRFDEARDTLMVYAQVVRHGLVPNLLDAANNPRYNARDATWFFLQGIQDYVEMSPEGEKFLEAPVKLKWSVHQWSQDLVDLEPRNIADVIHLILSAHAKGIHFREWNAGNKIDEHMVDNGFNISVTLDENTGIIYGGNVDNCGTWMDKMGSSAHAKNKGVPATPRDGAAVEIIGLLKSTLRWVSGLDSKVFPHTAVTAASGRKLSYKEWDARVEDNFEQLFWVHEDERLPHTSNRGIYRDTVGATRQWQDAQLRPNFCFAMTVAPELFSPTNAKQALSSAADKIVGPLGMCTLDPSDHEYRGDYHNDNDSEDKSIAHGWNYHQGPEWVWPLGYFLMAWTEFHKDYEQVPGKQVMRWLLQHRVMLSQSQWRSLPELTNSKGQVCHHSCPAQAWSISTLLDALYALRDVA